MMTHKNGYEFGLNNVILGVVFIIAAIVVSLKVHTALASESDIETCRASVNTKSISIKFASFGTRVADPVDLNLDCHTTDLFLKKDGVENQDGKTVAKFDEGRFEGKKYEDKLKTVMADSMENCWKMFGKGEIDPFTRLDGDKHCIQCYEIIFDGEAKDEMQKAHNKQTLDNFNKFLVDNIGSNRETYAKFLYKIEGQDEAAKKFTEDSPPLDINKQYAVIYYSARGNGVADAAAKAAEMFGCSSFPGEGTIKKFLGPFRRFVEVVDSVDPTCLQAKLVGFAIQGATAAFTTHQVGVANIPLDKMGSACRRLD